MLNKVLGDNMVSVHLEKIKVIDCRFPSKKWNNPISFFGKHVEIVLLLPQADWAENNIHSEITEAVIVSLIIISI